MSKTAYIFIGDKEGGEESFHHALGTTKEQLELFLIKYPEMDRDNLNYIIEVRHGDFKTLIAYHTF
jgi:hypothetical protein